MKNKELGNLGENIACSYIKDLGYEILQRNFRSKKGEIDIISYKNNMIIFTEVKTRKSFRYGLPIESVDIKKLETIKYVAREYIIYKKLFDYSIRFDVIEVYLKNNTYKVNLIENIV